MEILFGKKRLKTSMQVLNCIFTKKMIKEAKPAIDIAQHATIDFGNFPVFAVLLSG